MSIKCPCCSSKEYDDCCSKFISGAAVPTTPEELMRSRYTAFTKANVDYIFKTMRGAALKKSGKVETIEIARSAT